MKQTYLMLIAVWIMFGCMAVVAWQARRRSKMIDRWMAEDRAKGEE